MTQTLDPLLTPTDLCGLLGGGFTEHQLAQLRYLGKGPAFIKLTGRQVRYRQSDVAEWLESQRRTRTDGAVAADPATRSPISRRPGRSERRAATAEPRNGGVGPPGDQQQKRP